MFDYDRVVGRLSAIPAFCVGRVYRMGDNIIGRQYMFEFENGHYASVVKFSENYLRIYEKEFELAVLDRDGNLNYDTSVTHDVERGDEAYMHELLCEIERLAVPITKTTDPPKLPYQHPGT